MPRGGIFQRCSTGLHHGPARQRGVTLSHTTISHLLGARRQSVTRVLGELKRRGIVSSGYGRTVIHDAAGLREVMGTEPLP